MTESSSGFQLTALGEWQVCYTLKAIHLQPRTEHSELNLLMPTSSCLKRIAVKYHKLKYNELEHLVCQPLCTTVDCTKHKFYSPFGKFERFDITKCRLEFSEVSIPNWIQIKSFFFLKIYILRSFSTQRPWPQSTKAELEATWKRIANFATSEKGLRYIDAVHHFDTNDWKYWLFEN